jgi:hypothetical protein
MTAGTCPEYIRYYHHERISLKLKGLSPVQYRAQAFGPWLATAQLMGIGSRHQAVSDASASFSVALGRIALLAFSGFGR